MIIKPKKKSTDYSRLEHLTTKPYDILYYFFSFILYSSFFVLIFEKQ